MKKILSCAIILSLLISITVALTGCRKKVEEKIVCSKIIFTKNANSYGNKTITPNKKLLSTYEDLMNSKTIKTEIEEKYGTIGDIKFEEIENTEMIKISYVCDSRTDEEYKEMLNDWIAEFSKKTKEIYDIKVSIIDEPEITTRLVTK